jgi:DNA-binding NtrC family response regulator
METPTATVSVREKRKTRGSEILLIDAGRDRALAAAIVQQGYRLTSCTCVEAAWRRLYPKRPCAIIVHLRKPSSSDLPALQECRIMAEGVPVVLVTSGRLGTTLRSDRRLQTIAVFSRSHFIKGLRRILRQSDPGVAARESKRAEMQVMARLEGDHR